jgi:alkylation response protein AidB-like acyl-CoA dehydrogenase
VAQRSGRLDDPLVRNDMARAWGDLRILRYTALRSLGTLSDGAPGPAASISKLYWSQWFQRFGELAMRVRGTTGMVSSDHQQMDSIQQMWLFGRAATIFAGSSEIQRNILGESILGLAKEPRPHEAADRDVDVLTREGRE